MITAPLVFSLDLLPCFALLYLAAGQGSTLRLNDKRTVHGTQQVSLKLSPGRPVYLIAAYVPFLQSKA